MKRTMMRRAVAAAVALACAGSVAACGSSSSDESVATVVVTETSGTPRTGAPSSSPTSSATKPAGTPLAASFAAMSKTLSSPVGLALVPVGGGEVMTFGDQSPQVAWSTSKVPLALAAQRRSGPSNAEANAIRNSDNAAAEELWASLGTPEQAAAAVTTVLREGGDKNTTVPSQRLRPEFSIFGQTTWALSDAATFSANLPCLPDSRHVVTLMGEVSGSQQWGLEAIEGRPTAVKGGWGPSASGGYLVRQLGILTLKDGRQVGVAMSTQTAAGSMDSGTAVLSTVGQWLGKHLGALPAGRCA